MMNDEAKLLLRMLRASEAKLARLSGDSPFRAAAEQEMVKDIDRMKVQAFDALRATIEAMEGGR